MIARSLAVAALLLSSAASQALACSCSNGGQRTALRNSAAVYLGRVVGAGRVRATAHRKYQLTQLVVTESIKGVRTADTVAVDSEIDTSCSIELQIGAEYLVYAAPDPNGGTVPVTDYCLGTTTIACSADDLRTLGVSVPRLAGSCRPKPPGKRSLLGRAI